MHKTKPRVKEQVSSAFETCSHQTLPSVFLALMTNPRSNKQANKGSLENRWTGVKSVTLSDRQTANKYPTPSKG